MKYLKISLFILCLFIINNFPAKSQESESYKDISILKSEDFVDIDSITVIYRIEFDKETSSEFDDVFTFQSTERKDILSKKEIKKLNNYIFSEKSYTNSVAGLSHSDIIFTYFKNNSVIMSINISSITRNISIIKGSDIVLNGISPQFEKYITQLLRKKKIWPKKKSFSEQLEN